MTKWSVSVSAPSIGYWMKRSGSIPRWQTTMIDEDWLNSLDFVCEGGLRFRGLAGVGALSITFIAYGEDDEKFAIKARRHHLGFHIREIPLFMSGAPMYDVDRVNRKLSKLIGNDNLDETTSAYDKLFDALVATFHNEEKMIQRLCRGLVCERHRSVGGMAILVRNADDAPPPRGFAGYG